MLKKLYNIIKKKGNTPTNNLHSTHPRHPQEDDFLKSESNVRNNKGMSG
jgi:hypothetical protein